MKIQTFNDIDYTTPKEAAKALGVAQQTIHRYIREGRLSVHVMSQRKHFIPVSDVEALMP